MQSNYDLNKCVYMHSIICMASAEKLTKDSPSNGKRNGKNSSLRPGVRELWLRQAAGAWVSTVKVDLERQVGEGESVQVMNTY